MINASPIKISKHAAKRASQRGFRESDIRFVIENGTETSEGFFLRRKDADLVAEQAKRLEGTFVPWTNGCAVSIYRVGGRKRRHLHREGSTQSIPRGAR